MSRWGFLFAFLFSTSAMAEQGAVAVLDISGTGVDATLLPTLTEVLTVEIDNLGMYKVIGGRDVQAMLGFEKTKDMVGCTDAACLAEIGGALGVDRIVASHIGKVGQTYVVNIKLINIRMADTEARVYQTVKGEVDALIKTITTSVNKLLGPGSKAAKTLGLTKKATVAAPAPTPEPTPEPTPAQPEPDTVAAVEPPPPTVTESGGGLPKITWLPITLWVVGAGGVAGGAILGSSAKSLEDEANQTIGKTEDGRPIYEVGAQRAAEDAESMATFANISYIVGGAAIAGGVLVWLLSGDDEPTATALVPVLGPDNVGFAVSGQF